MIRIAGVLAVLALAGCGVDGEPVQPSVSTTIGVNSNGVNASTGVAVTKGPISVGVGLGL